MCNGITNAQLHSELERAIDEAFVLAMKAEERRREATGQSINKLDVAFGALHMIVGRASELKHQISLELAAPQKSNKEPSPS